MEGFAVLSNLTRAGAIVVIILSSGASHAQNGNTYGDATAPLIASLLRARGLPAQVNHTSSGSPYVRSRLDGFKFSVFMFACNKQAKPIPCKGIQFYSGYKMSRPLTYARMNEWNRTKRYARGYVQRDAATGQLTKVRIEMDLSFSGGMTRSIFMAHLNLFRRLNKVFRQHIGFN
jgi:hypothetical protein